MHYFRFDLNLTICLILQFISQALGQIDRTLEPLANGKDVAEAACNKVTNVFGDDHRFLIRLAWVESQFGKSGPTFRRGYYGGIWQVGLIPFVDTQNIFIHKTNLTLAHKQIKDEFGIDWMNVRWSDLTRPLYSAIAARLYIFNKGIPIPSSVEEQGHFWRTFYNLNTTKASKENYMKEIKSLESCKANKSKCRLALIILLDGSGSIGYTDFSRARQFVFDLFNCVSNEQVIISFLVYSSGVKTIIPFRHNLNPLEIGNRILNARYPNNGTATAPAINTAVDMLMGLSNSSLPQIMIVLTDGQSDSPHDTAKAASNANRHGIISYAVGIGTRYNYLELGQIADSRKDQILTISSYSHLTDLLYQIKTKTCSKPVRSPLYTQITDSVDQSEVTYYGFNVTRGVGGISIYFNVTAGNAIGFYSYKVENPSAALNDGVLEYGHNYLQSNCAFDENNQMEYVFIAIEGTEKGTNNFTLYGEERIKNYVCLEASASTYGIRDNVGIVLGTAFFIVSFNI